MRDELQAMLAAFDAGELEQGILADWLEEHDDPRAAQARAERLTAQDIGEAVSDFMPSAEARSSLTFLLYRGSGNPSLSEDALKIVNHLAHYRPRDRVILLFPEYLEPVEVGEKLSFNDIRGWHRARQFEAGEAIVRRILAPGRKVECWRNDMPIGPKFGCFWRMHLNRPCVAGEPLAQRFVPKDTGRYAGRQQAAGEMFA